LKRQEQKSPGTNFGNVWEACNQETAIRKRRVQIAGRATKPPCSPTKLRILESNSDFLFYKTYRRNSSEYYFKKEKVKDSVIMRNCIEIK